MGFYETYILPRAVDRACGSNKGVRFRARVCAGLYGRVVEIGFGSGLNVNFLPSTVSAVAAVEPSDVAWRLAVPRIASVSLPVQRVGRTAEAIPLDDDSCDSALSTWTLCTVPDVEAALAELIRVLRPGGELHFVDHGLAADPRVQRWQYRLDPIQKRLAGGCHLTRPIVELVAAAGFEVVKVDTVDEPGSANALTANTVGVAVAPLV